MRRVSCLTLAEVADTHLLLSSLRQYLWDIHWLPLYGCFRLLQLWSWK
jgi:hypothetical protein